MKTIISRIAFCICCASFAMLLFIGVSSIAKALTVVAVENESGVPSSWSVTEYKKPSSITLPITYWDQKMDACSGSSVPRQFEWTACRQSVKAHTGLVKSVLGADGLPIPAYISQVEAKAAGIDPSSQNVVGHDPVEFSDNFYRWFHEVDGLSKKYEKTITFSQVGDSNKYVYGGSDIFPLDDVDFSKGDSTNSKHNFHFTAHFNTPIQIKADGNETFDFTGDDDVWVFLNKNLVLDLGGVHGALKGSFKINTDGTITSSTNGNLDLGLEPGEIVDMDFFYAERSSTGSNTLITITNMEVMVDTSSTLTNRIIDNKMVEYNVAITNNNLDNIVDIDRFASYVTLSSENGETETGFLPLDVNTLSYTTTPEDPGSWQPLDISAPSNDEGGFKFSSPITLSQNGKPGDTVYLRFYVSPEISNGMITNTTSFFAQFKDASAMSSNLKDLIIKTEAVSVFENLNTEPEEPEPLSGNTDTPPEEAEPHTDGNNTSAEDSEVSPGLLIEEANKNEFYPKSDNIITVPSTGIINSIPAIIFTEDFAEVILSQTFTLVVLIVFSASFAVWFPLRKFGFKLKDQSN